MRHAFMLLAATVVMLVATTSDAFAQWGRNFGRGNSSYYGNRSYWTPNYGYSNYGYSNYGRSNYGYSNYGRSGFGIQFYNSGYNNFGYNRGLYGNSYSYYTPSYVAPSYIAPSYIAPSYYQAAPSYNIGPSTYSVMPATYSEAHSALSMPSVPQNPNDDSLATIIVTVPTSDTQVWFGDTLMSQTGISRTFKSTPLDLDKNYSYVVRARWMSQGTPIDQSRKVDIRAGQVSKVDFTSSKLQTVPQPIIK